MCFSIGIFQMQPSAEIFEYLCDLVDEAACPLSIQRIAKNIILDGRLRLVPSRSLFTLFQYFLLLPSLSRTFLIPSHVFEISLYIFYRYPTFDKRFRPELLFVSLLFGAVIFLSVLVIIILVVSHTPVFFHNFAMISLVVHYTYQMSP